jgi:hypothetical protein
LKIFELSNQNKKLYCSANQLEDKRSFRIQEKFFSCKEIKFIVKNYKIRGERMNSKGKGLFYEKGKFKGKILNMKEKNCIGQTYKDKKLSKKLNKSRESDSY